MVSVETTNEIILLKELNHRVTALEALTSWKQIGAVTLENIDKNEVMYEAFVTLQNIQGIMLI